MHTFPIDCDLESISFLSLLTRVNPNPEVTESDQNESEESYRQEVSTGNGIGWKFTIRISSLDPIAKIGIAKQLSGRKHSSKHWVNDRVASRVCNFFNKYNDYLSTDRQ